MTAVTAAVSTLAPLAEPGADHRLDPERPLPGPAPLALVVRRRWRLFVIVPVVLALVGVAIALLTPITFTSNASFVPAAARGSAGGLASLGAQFGLQLPGNDASQSPAFYTDLVTSDAMLGQVAQRAYPLQPGAKERPLAELLEVEETPGPLRDEKTIKKLRKAVTASANAKTTLVRVQVRAPSAHLAQRIAVDLLEGVDRFNIERRRTSARAERQFTERRLADVTRELARAEDRLALFRLRNLDYRPESPLRVESSRLERQVSLLTALQTSLSQSFEQARIEEVRDTPLIAVVESPSLPARRDSRGAVRLALTGAVLGLMLAAALAFMRQALDPGTPRRAA